MGESKKDTGMWAELMKAYINLTYIKNLIEDSVEIKEGELSIKNYYSFSEDLIKLIKYTDTEFYNNLKKQLGADIK